MRRTVLAELPALLSAIESAFADAGISRSAIRKAFADAGRAKYWGRRRATLQREQAFASTVIYRWYNTPDYVHRDGTPRILPERGKAPSIAALVRECVPAGEHAKVVRILRRTESIRVNDDGQWELRAANLLRVSDVLAAHRLTGLVEAVLRMGLRNLESKNSQGAKWFDRKAYVGAIPDRYARMLERRASEQLSQPLESISSWLEEVALNRGKRSMREIGVICFQYELPKLAFEKEGAGRGRALRPRKALEGRPRKQREPR